MKKMVYVLGLLFVLGLGLIIGMNVEKDDILAFNTQTSFDSVEALSYTEEQLDATFEDADQVDTFMALHQALIEKHQNLLVKHQQLSEAREVFQTSRTAFKDLDVRLSYEDGIALWTNYHNLLNIKDDFKATQGLAYQRLIDLKGLYDVEHLDLIIQTYQEVLDVLNQRESLIDQAIQLFSQSTSIYQNYMI